MQTRDANDTRSHDDPGDRRVSGATRSGADEVYRAGAAGARCWSRSTGGVVRTLPMDRWFGGSSASNEDRRVDDLMLRNCATGPVLDVGCGPGRLTESLNRRGCPTLGVDTSPIAVHLTRQRGGTAIRHDFFDPLPAEGRWQHVLLADGNIGIGGDPRRVLRRAAELLETGGTVIVEVDSASVITYEVQRWETGQHIGHWFPWSRVGISALIELAEPAGLAMQEVLATPWRTIAVLG